MEYDSIMSIAVEFPMEDFKFMKVKRPFRLPVILTKAEVRRNLKKIFKESDAPADENDGRKSQFAEPFPLREFQMPIPGQRHKAIGDNKERDRHYRLYHTHHLKVHTIGCVIFTGKVSVKADEKKWRSKFNPA